MKPVNWVASAGLTAGILGFLFPPLMLVALVCGVMGLRRSRDPRRGGRRTAVLALWLGMIAVLCWVGMVSLFFYWADHRRDGEAATTCVANMRQIGSALELYCHENGGHYPPDLSALITAADLYPEVFVCPKSDDTPAPGADPIAQAAHLQGHCSYVYLGAGLVGPVPADRVILYESPENHWGASVNGADGTNVLYGDGRVGSLAPAEGHRVVEELKAGRNPPDSTDR